MGFLSGLFFGGLIGCWIAMESFGYAVDKMTKALDEVLEKHGEKK